MFVDYCLYLHTSVLLDNNLIKQCTYNMHIRLQYGAGITSTPSGNCHPPYKDSRGTTVQVGMGGPNHDTLEVMEEFRQTPQPIPYDLANQTIEEDRESRTLKIECENTDQNYMMLKRSKTLARQESTHAVYIEPDLTRNERLANKDLC